VYPRSRRGHQPPHPNNPKEILKAKA